MKYFPNYLKEYPNMNATFPLFIGKNHLIRGYPSHRHDFLEFTYVIEGKGSETINGITHPMVPGTFTFVLPYQIHEIFTEPGSTLISYVCNFRMEYLMEQGMDLGLRGLLEECENLPSFLQFEGEDEVRMRLLLDEMADENSGSNVWRTAMLKVKLAEALIRFDRLRRTKFYESRVTEEKSNLKNMIWPVLYYIHQNYQEELTLFNLGKRFGMSVSYLSECIKKTIGQTFLQFLHDLRIRHASSLLSATEMSVVEIAFEVGYRNYKTFSRLFREHKGVVPSVYRKEKHKA